MRHLRRPAGYTRSDDLRRRYNEQVALWHQLRHIERHVAGTRGQVEQKIIEISPNDIVEELAQNLTEHRATPDDRCVVLNEITHRNDLHAMSRDRDDLAIDDGRSPPFDAYHAGHAKAV